LSSLPSFADSRFFPKLKQAFPLCENISIDFAVLEHARNVVGLACDDIGWSDVGSWDAVHELLPHDSDGNASRSGALYEASSGNYVDARGKLVVLLGVHDLIVVDTPDAHAGGRSEEGPTGGKSGQAAGATASRRNCCNFTPPIVGL